MSVEVRAFADLDPRTAYDVWRLRQDVFVVEQACAYPDLDGRDLEPATRHLVLRQEGRVIGYLRLLDEGAHARIGRVALAPDVRGHGLADVLVVAALHEAVGREARLDAQVPLRHWYAGFGFEVSGPEFLDDGIAHVPMVRAATPAPPR